MAWVFLTQSKDPPIDIVRAFLALHGHSDGGCIRTDQGGELASSGAFRDLLLREFRYSLELTGADSPSQNGAVEIYNDKLGIRTRALLYGAGLPAKYWSAALVHSVYLHNRLVHSTTLSTPFGLYYGVKPDLEFLRTFGSRVCVKRSGDRRAKLDRHDFTGIFLGYTATDQNIVYLDLDSGIVKHSHHATFDEAWYLQPAQPPAAQLLYDLGLEADELDILLSDNSPNDALLSTCPSTPPSAPWPPLYDHHTTFRLDESTTTTNLPPFVPRSTRPLRRNSTTLVKHNLLLSINIRHPHRQIGHGDINKTISQFVVDPLTPRSQRPPTKGRLRRASLSRRPLISVTNNQKIASAPRFSGVQKLKQQYNNKTGHTERNPLHTSKSHRIPTDIP
jgi:hypothetical protein